MSDMEIRIPNPINDSHLRKIREIIGKGPVLITTHDNPDPDALASGKAIYYLIHEIWGISTRLIYGGGIDRAENKSMHQLLTPEWEHISLLNEISQFSTIIYTDCQPGSRNSIKPQPSIPTIIFDHHAQNHNDHQNAAYMDVRENLGATATMIFEYLNAAGVIPDSVCSTAMFLGIQTDTIGLSRGASIEDGLVYVKLLETLDQRLLLRIHSAGLANEYYEAFYQGIRNARLYGRTIISYLGNIHRSDLTAEMADLLFRHEGTQVALCSGIYQNTLYFSIRTGLLEKKAASLVQEIVFPPGEAGGHMTMAGGQIPIGDDPVRDVNQLEQRCLSAVGERNIGNPLIPNNFAPTAQ